MLSSTVVPTGWCLSYFFLWIYFKLDKGFFSDTNMRFKYEDYGEISGVWEDVNEFQNEERISTDNLDPTQTEEGASDGEVLEPLDPANFRINPNAEEGNVDGEEMIMDVFDQTKLKKDELFPQTKLQMDEHNSDSDKVPFDPSKESDIDQTEISKDIDHEISQDAYQKLYSMLTF